MDTNNVHPQTIQRNAQVGEGATLSLASSDKRTALITPFSPGIPNLNAAHDPKSAMNHFDTKQLAAMPISWGFRSHDPHFSQDLSKSIYADGELLRVATTGEYENFMADFVCPVLMPEAALSGLTVAKNGTLPLAEYGSASPLRHVEWR